LQIILNYIV